MGTATSTTITDTTTTASTTTITTTTQEIIAGGATYELVTNAAGRTGWCKEAGVEEPIRGIFAHAECEQQCTDDTSCTAYSYSEVADSESVKGCKAHCWREKCRVYTGADVVFTSGHINVGSSGVHCYQKTAAAAAAGPAPAPAAAAAAVSAPVPEEQPT